MRLSRIAARVLVIGALAVSPATAGTFVFGGPGSLEGRFEDEGGLSSGGGAVEGVIG